MENNTNNQEYIHTMVYYINPNVTLNNNQPMLPEDIEILNSIIMEDFANMYSLLFQRMNENTRKKLTPEQIDKLNYKNESFECSICFTDRNDKINLDCNHSFCKKCLYKWFSKNNTCPCCRKEIVVEN